MDLALKVLLIGWVICLLWVPFVIIKNREEQPGALFLLFVTELWERFSYYGMRALLVLYLIDNMHDGLEYDQPKAYAIYGLYGALVYGTPVLGGLLSERLFGYRNSIIWGGILMAAGQFTMASIHGSESETMLYIALGLIIVGNGFFKPNISSFVGRFYGDGDERRDRGFNLFYMGINVGAFLAPLTCGYFGQNHEDFGWNYGFLIAGIGMVVGLAVFMYGASKGLLEDKGHSPNPELLAAKSFLGISNKALIYVGTLLVVPLLFGLFHISEEVLFEVADVPIGAAEILLFVTISFMLGYLFVYGKGLGKVPSDKINVILLLFFGSTLFWTFFELAGSAINVYTETNVDKVVSWLDDEPLSASQLQGVNPLYIIVFAPLFNMLWRSLNKRNWEPSAPAKFGIGIALLGLGFFIFPLGGEFANEGIVPLGFLLLVYLLHTLGELCLSPVGLSLVTKLSPKEKVGFVMGFWFLSSSLALLLGKFIASETSSANLTPEEALDKYNSVFWNVGLWAVIAGAVFLVISPIVKKWMHGTR